MAKFLTTSGTAHQIEEILKNATTFVTIVTPYLKLSGNIVERLRDAVNRNIKLTIIYGKDEYANDQIRLIESFPTLKLYFYQNLHAKCYFNETDMIISSMNLHEYSEKNNREMSVFFTKKEDTLLYADGEKEVQSIIGASKLKIENKSLGKTDYVNDPATDKVKVEKQVEEEVKKLVTYDSPIAFILPTLYEKLQKNYPGQNFKLEENGIFIENFPREKVDLEITGRIDFLFNDSNLYERISDYSSKILKSNPAQNRYYFNHNRINIYLPQKHKIENTESGMQDVLTRYFEIITTTVDELKKVK